MDNFKKLFFILLAGVSIVLGLATIAGFGGAWDWRLDMFNHARPLLFCFLILTFIVSLLIRSKLLSLLNFIFLFINFVFLSPLYLSESAKQKRVITNKTFSLLQFNVCAPEHNRSKLIKFLKDKQPDIVALEECDELCFNALKKGGVIAKYPFVFHQKPLMKRLLLLSRFPAYEEPKYKFFADPAILRVKLKINKRWVHLLMMHSTRPSSGREYYFQQIRQFDELAHLIQQAEPEPTILCGDLNTTPWGYSFQRLIHKSGLKNSMNGFGWQASFPTFVYYKSRRQVLPFLPIDHVLVSKEINVASRKVGPNLLSDHLPIIVDLHLMNGAD